MCIKIKVRKAPRHVPRGPVKLEDAYSTKARKTQRHIKRESPTGTQFSKLDPKKRTFCEYCEFFKNNHFKKHPRMAASRAWTQSYLTFQRSFKDVFRKLANMFISNHRRGFSWLKKINVMPEFKSAFVCWENTSESRTFVSALKTFIERTFKVATV